MFDGVLDKISGLDSTTMITGLSSVFGKVMFYVKILIYFALFVFGAILAYKKFFEYNIIVTLKNKIGGGGVEIIRTRAKIQVDVQGKRKLILYKKLAKKVLTCPVPPGEFKGKIGKRDHYELWVDDNFQLQYISHPTLDKEDEHLIAIRPQEREAWFRFETKNIIEKMKKKDLIEKFLPFATLGIVCITAFLLFFFGFQELGSAMNNLAGNLGQIASSCTALK